MVSYKIRGNVYSFNVQRAMLQDHASKTWPLTKPNLKHLVPKDIAMIRQRCSIKPEDVVNKRSRPNMTSCSR